MTTAPKLHCRPKARRLWSGTAFKNGRVSHVQGQEVVVSSHKAADASTGPLLQKHFFEQSQSHVLPATLSNLSHRGTLINIKVTLKGAKIPC